MTKGVQEKHLNIVRVRFVFGLGFIMLAYLAVIVRLADLTLLQPITEKHVVKNTGSVQERSPYAPFRADIVDRNGTLLATSLKMASLYADATLVLDAKDLASRIVKILPDKNEAKLIKLLSSSRRFVWIHRDVTPKQKYALNAIGDPALGFEKEDRRIYPAGNLLAHVVGYTDIDGKGIAGVERSFDKELREDTEPFALSIDLRVQHILHGALSKSVDKFHAKGGMGMVMDVNSGEVIAMVSLPDFDPNHPTEGKKVARFNRASLGVSEMGSTFKIFSTAAVLESGLVNFNTMMDARTPLKYGRFTISDYHGKNRKLTVPEVFIHSSNIGTARMAELLPKGGLKSFYKSLGFLELSPIDLPERAKPLYPKPWRDIHTVTTSYGHGIAVTPVHVARAASAMVNGGLLVTPRVTKPAENNDQSLADSPRVISAKTSTKIRKLMALTVRKGTGRKAVAEGYDVGGKTGTAEKNINGRYVHGKVMSSFLSAFPMRDPRYVVMVVVDEPQPIKESFGYVTGGWTAAPVVAEVVSKMAPLYGIMPDFDADGAITKGMSQYLRGEKKVAVKKTY